MAPPFKRLILLVISPLIFTFLFNNPTTAIAAIEIKADVDLLNQICDQSMDKSFCLTTLKSDLRSTGADLHGLELISISSTINQVMETSEKITEILKNVTDQVGKQRLQVCQSDYADALAKFQGAFKSSDARSYMDVINWVRDGNNKVVDCENIYRRTNPIAESPLTADNHTMLKLVEIILIINDILIRS